MDDLPFRIFPDSKVTRSQSHFSYELSSPVANVEPNRVYCRYRLWMYDTVRPVYTGECFSNLKTWKRMEERKYNHIDG